MHYKNIITVLALSLSACSANGCPKNVLVKAEDNILKIAKQNHCNQVETIQLKKVHGNNIKKGEIIRINCGCNENYITQQDIDTIMKNKPSGIFITRQDIDFMMNRKFSQKITNYMQNINPHTFVRIMKNKQFFDLHLNQPLDNNSYPLQKRNWIPWSWGKKSYHYPEAIHLCNPNGCSQNIFQNIPTTPQTNNRRPQVTNPPVAQVNPHQQQNKRNPPIKQSSAIPAIPPKGAGKLESYQCKPIKGRVTDNTGRPVVNAKITVLMPNVAAFEYRSIRDSGDVLFSTRSNAQGNYFINRNLSKDFKYSLLVEEKGHQYKEHIIDQTKNCPTRMINIKMKIIAPI